MSGILKLTTNALTMARQYPRAWHKGRQQAAWFASVDTYCEFIGYPRSGHSLIGALLDAHPDIIVAHQMGALKYIHAGFSRNQVFALLLENSQARGSDRRGRYYSYQVPGQWQGRFRRLKVIGDKQGDGTTLRLRARPWLLQRLRTTVNVRLRFIHVIRNPYDNISTIWKLSKRWTLAQSLDYYFSLCDTIASVKNRLARDELFELRHESFIDSPQAHLTVLCQFLGVEASDEYLRDCASIVFTSPHRTRYDAPWTSELIERANDGIARCPPLHGYSYEA